MGRLLADLARKMQARIERPLAGRLHESDQAAADEEGALKMLVHSTHDTALAGLCATLDVFDEK